VTTIFININRDGRTEQASGIDPGWLSSSTGVSFRVDLAAPSVSESLILPDAFAFRPLAAEHAMSAFPYTRWL
jgi:hypothetical protein